MNSLDAGQGGHWTPFGAEDWSTARRLLLASQRPTARGLQRHVNGSSWAILPPSRGRALCRYR